MVVPGGCLDTLRRQGKKREGKYLFNTFALAHVFRARLLDAWSLAGLSLPANLPNKGVVDCAHVGKGKPALTYLARYLYRDVISENNIIADEGEKVTFRYLDSQTKETRSRTMKGEDFLWLLLQHVLPKGFRRVRDYGFLHGNIVPRATCVRAVC
ncbi:MAG: transposase [Proteobacteria bacterium]|nr:transposase [Pseudomonadota bacterium]